MIERYVIIYDGKTIESIDDLPLEKKEKCNYIPDDAPMVRVYDRLSSKMIAKVFTPDILLNYQLASAIITELENNNVKEIDG